MQGLPVSPPLQTQNVQLLPAASASKASIASSVLNLANTIMGSGLLTLPSAFASCGMVSGLLLAFGAAAANVLTLHLLTTMFLNSSSSQRPSMATLAFAAFGKPGAAVVDAAVISYSFGVCSGYLIVATDSLVDITNVPHRPLWTLLAACVVAPLSLLRAIDSLAFTSALAIIALGAISLVIVVYSLVPSLDACAGFAAGTVTCHVDDPQEHHETTNGSVPWELPCPGDVEWAPQPLMPTIQALSKFVLAFGCQQNLLPIVAELREPTPSRTLLVNVCAVALALSSYVVVATSGYLTFGHSVCSNVLNTYARTPIVALVRAFIAAVVLTSYPLLAFEARRALVSALVHWSSTRRHRPRVKRRAATDPGSPDRDAPKATTPERGASASARSGGGGMAPPEEFESSSGRATGDRERPSRFVKAREERGVVSFFLVATISVALAVSDLGLVLGLVGASGGVVISFIVPSACFVRLAPPGTSAAMRAAAMAMLMFSLVLLPLAIVIQLV